MTKERKRSKVITSTDFVDVVVRKPLYGEPVDTAVHGKTISSPEMSFVLDCIKAWGLVGAVEDGESSDGRQKLRLHTPEEVVKRAFSLAEMAFAQGEQRGWVVTIPNYEDIEREAYELDESND